MRTNRRVFLGAGLAAVGGTALSACSGQTGGGAASPGPVDAADADAAATRIAASTVPFFGERQAGISTPPQAHAIFRAFDLEDVGDAARERAQLEGVLRVWTDDAARLTSGRGGLADNDAELADGPANLTVTVGFGPRLFDLIGLPERRPAWLQPLPPFEIDRLEDEWSGGDLLVQVCADDPLIVANASRVLAAGVRGAARSRWTQSGFRRAAGTTAPGTTQRNLFGQLDGTINPDPAGPAVFCGPDEPQAWMRGGAGLVLRRIAMDLTLWEAVDPPQRDLSMGRRQRTGAPLTGERETDPVDLDAIDSTGLPVIPAESHVARAHARSPEEVFLRRPYNFLVDVSGAPPSAGLLFAAYAANPERQFLPVQQRLAAVDLLNTWTTPIGSAVFALPPGVPAPGAGTGGYLGEPMLA